MVLSDPDSDEDDEEQRRRSSDSDEEDLASLPRIHQQPDQTPATASGAASCLRSSAAEDMDVSSTDGLFLCHIVFSL